MKILKDPRSLIRLAAILVLLVVGGIYAGRFISGILADRTNKEAQNLYHSASSPAATKTETTPAAETIPLEETTAAAVKESDSAEPSAEESTETLAETTAQPEEESGDPVIAEDFLPLLAVNDEIVGWLTVSDTIDFPVVQGDNNYYLSHNFKKESDSNGSIILNSCNTLFPRDDILLIHGHKTSNGRMFGPLLKFSSFNYLREHPVLMFRTIYDAEPVYYTPVTAFDASMFKPSDGYFDIARILFENDPEQPEEGRASTEFQEYLDGSAARSEWKTRVEYSVDDSYILLITCSYNRLSDDLRFCMLCRKLRPNETPEMIEALYAQ